MAAKKIDPMVANMKAISQMYCEVLSTVDIQNLQLIDQLDGNDQRDFAKWCHEVFYSPHFNLLVKNFIYAQAMLVTEKGYDQIAYNNGQMTINGIHMLRELIHRYANIYDVKFSGKEDSYDPYRSFEPGKVENT